MIRFDFWVISSISGSKFMKREPKRRVSSMTEAQIAEIQAALRPKGPERLSRPPLSENTRTRIACAQQPGGPGANGA